MNQTSLNHKSYSEYDRCELARTFESKNLHKYYKQIATELWKMGAFGKEYHLWMFAECQSVSGVLYQLLNAVQ